MGGGEERGGGKWGGPHLWQRQIICNLMCLKTAGENVNGGGALNVGNSSGAAPNIRVKRGRTRENQENQESSLDWEEKLPSRVPEMFETDENASSIKGLKTEDELEGGDNLQHQIPALLPVNLLSSARTSSRPSAPCSAAERLVGR